MAAKEFRLCERNGANSRVSYQKNPLNHHPHAIRQDLSLPSYSKVFSYCLQNQRYDSMKIITITKYKGVIDISMA